MYYYLKRCGFQELGSVGEDGVVHRGRYLLTTMDDRVLRIFPALSTTQKNDAALLAVLPLYSGKKVYCNFVYHNDKFHHSTARHPRNEYRLYLNQELEEGRLLFEQGDIMIMRQAQIEEEDGPQIVYVMDLVKPSAGAFYAECSQIIEDSPLPKNYGIYEGDLAAFEEQVRSLPNAGETEVAIDRTVMRQISAIDPSAVARLFSASSFRDFVLVGYNYRCGITGMVIRSGAYNNLEAAHIRPKSHGGSFLPSNGIAMCRDLHWAFDKRFFTFSDDLKVIVHPQADSDYLRQFDGQSLRVPDNVFFAPDPEQIQYHREHIYGIFTRN